MTKTSKPNNRGLMFLLGGFLVVAAVVFAVANMGKTGTCRRNPASWLK